MIVPLLLLLLSLGMVLIGLFSGQPFDFPVTALGVVMAVASLFLLWRAIGRRPRKWIVVDGSNVMHWQDEIAMLDTVGLVLRMLIKQGYYPVVWFDANVGYKVSDRFMDDRALAHHLPVPPQQIMVSPAGTPADPLLLEGAQRLKARVVTRDRFRDWATQFPEVGEPGFLVRGQVVNGAVTLEME